MEHVDITYEQVRVDKKQTVQQLVWVLKPGSRLCPLSRLSSLNNYSLEDKKTQRNEVELFKEIEAKGHLMIASSLDSFFIHYNFILYSEAIEYKK